MAPKKPPEIGNPIIRLVADFAQPTSISQEIVRITKSSSIAPLPNVL